MSLQIIMLDHAQSSVGTACLILDGNFRETSYKKLCVAIIPIPKGWKPSCFSGVSSTTQVGERLPLPVCANKQSCLLKYLLSLLLPLISLHRSRNLTTSMLHSETSIIFLFKLSKGIRIIFIVTSETMLRLLEKDFLKTPIPCPRQGN